MIKICVAGADGRMGRAVIEEAVTRGFAVVGAVEAPNSPKIGKTLREAGICGLDTIIVDPTKIDVATKEADVYVSFTTPDAEMSNIPAVANLGKRIVMGTTGFTEQQYQKLKDEVSKKVPAVFSPNYAIGVNVVLRMMKVLTMLPADYDFSITEVHHIGKKDAPSGTAKALGNAITPARGYRSVVYGREGIAPRKREELEILSVRAGGVPGIHDVIAAGPHEMIRVEHVAFSRRVFAQGALYAVEWISKQTKPGVYSMDDILGFC
ncbi:MAG: 4-hydroxy-tetrahydrodipicolinate reductase [Nitrososphaerota archaeon]|nr:4-hydroxy-tetrahydrodipicolinate reductase [Candidatus Bathyarchaeota archaeon]MDW8048305.1 4-hydroxy-tetrahydrodipicolinate reductase [Nitrososphaerota archaeon]